MFTVRETKNAPAALGPYSQAVLWGNLLFTSGQIGINPQTAQLVEGGIKGQTEQVMKNLQAVLGEYGASFENVVKTTCFIADMSDFADFNAVYEKHFSSHKPARSCVAVRELPKGALCEIEVTAVIE